MYIVGVGNKVQMSGFIGPGRIMPAQDGGRNEEIAVHCPGVGGECIGRQAIRGPLIGAIGSNCLN